MDNKIGGLIRKIRNENNDRLEDLGKKIGYSYSGLAKIERGLVKPSIELLEKIANVYGESVSYFIGEKQNIPKELENKTEWISFIGEMEERDISPEELKQILNFMDNFNQRK